METKKQLQQKTKEDIAAELSYLKEKKICAWGIHSDYAEIFLSFVKDLKLDFVAFCDNNQAYWGTEYGGYPVISPEEFQEHLKKDPDLLMQISVRSHSEEAVLAQVEGYGVKHIIPSMNNDMRIKYYFTSLLQGYLSQYSHSYEEKIQNGLTESFTRSFDAKITILSTLEEEFKQKQDSILICQLPKTADMALEATFSKYRRSSIFCQHHQKMLSYCEKVTKITMAVREPISRDLSEVFQNISAGTLLLQNFTFEQLNQAILSDNYQDFFDIYPKYGLKKTSLFFESCKNYGLNVLDFPFDQEKGYTIIKTGNFDIFLYQLEKLNDLIPELSVWSGVSFTELEKSNVASEKWVANSYKKAQKTIGFSQEYFDYCYNDPYIQHCYSKEDIEKFKDRWRANIL